MRWLVVKRFKQQYRDPSTALCRSDDPSSPASAACNVPTGLGAARGQRLRKGSCATTQPARN
jgi:hypothetical protein